MTLRCRAWIWTRVILTPWNVWFSRTRYLFTNPTKLSTVTTKTCLSCFHLVLLQDMERSLLKDTRLKLEDVTFDIQCFISEHAQFLSPSQSSHLLKVLSSTQRAFRDQTEGLVTQRKTLDVLLDTRERENQEKVCLRMCYKMSQRLHWFAKLKVT